MLINFIWRFKCSKINISKDVYNSEDAVLIKPIAQFIACRMYIQYRNGLSKTAE